MDNLFQSQANQDIAEREVREFLQESGTRGTIENHWQEIAQRLIPNESPYFNAFSQIRATGEKRTQFIFDSTGAIALQRFAAIMDSLLTPANQKWHRLKAADRELNKQRDVQLYFEDVNELLFKHRYAPWANFQANNHMNYVALGAYGTGCLFIDKNTTQAGVRYKYIHLSQIYFQENHQGIIDKARRYFPLSARQAYQKWGDKCPPAIVEKSKSSPETQFFFLHSVRPREELDVTRKDFRGMKWASYYISMEGKWLLSEQGYNTFPYAISRYEQFGNEVYGRSPAMNVLPAVKTLNEQKKAMLKQAHRAADPVLLAHDDGVLDSFNLRPGAVNTGGVTSDGRPLVHVLPTGNFEIAKEAMDEERKVINDAFLVSLFQILTESPQMTATEVLERIKEKAILIAPTLGRQQSECQGPEIDRELDLLSQQGLLPPMPLALQQSGGQYKVYYDSPLSKAQRAEEAAGFQRTVEQALNIANSTGNPEVLDIFNFDVAGPEIADINGTPYHWMNDPKKIAQIRSGRMKDKETAQLTQAAPAAAAMISAHAKAMAAGQ